MEDRVIIVSGDSHAGVPKELWTEYLPQQYHELLPQLRRDTDVYPMAIFLMGAKRRPENLEEHEIAHRDDWHGLHDPVLRLADMDREGVAAEVIYLGDSRLGDMFHNVTGRDFGLDAWEAGAKGWNRWAADTFGFATDRFLVTGAIGPCVDMDASVAEVHWMADHHFAGVYAPGVHAAPRHACAPRFLLGPVLGGVRRAQHRRSWCTLDTAPWPVRPSRRWSASTTTCSLPRAPRTST